MNKTNQPYLSLVVPAYKAEKFIYKSLSATKQVLNEIDRNNQLICVVDGNVDSTEKQARRVEGVTVISYPANMGKGYAVRFGMQQSRGKYIGFMDAGLDLNPRGLIMLMEHLSWYKADVVVASKRHPVSKVSYPFKRRFISWWYQMLIRILFGLKVRDTQVGMKIFKSTLIHKMLPKLLVKRFAFDIELLAVAHHLGYTRIYEAPVELVDNANFSTIANVGFIKTALSMFKDTLAVFYRLKIIRYYD